MRYVLLSVSILPLLLSSCARVTITDQVWRGDIGTQGAVCYHTLTDEEHVIPQPQWDNERFGQICTYDAPDERGKTFGEIKQWLEQLCSLSRRCHYPETERIMRFLDRAIEASERALELRRVPK